MMVREVDDYKARLRRMYTAYAQSDIELIMASLDDEFVWVCNAPTNFFRFGGRHEGRARVLVALASFAADYIVHTYDIAEMICEGDVVWVSCRPNFTERRSGTHLTFSLAARWQYRGTKIIRCDEYYDTASFLLQEGRIAPAVKA
jgi:ketosteroid isomerase-like protein